MRQKMLIFLISYAFSGISFADGASRLRVILVNDGANSSKRGADLTSGCDGDQGGMENLMAEAFKNDPNRVTVEVLAGDDVSPTGIRNLINGLATQPTENIFFFYCGHGGWDKTRGHFLMMGLEGNMLRSEIRQLLVGKGVRGIVLITDACTSFANFEFYPQAAASENEIIDDLFMKMSGLVDITSSTMGQESWFSKSGSVFESSLNKVLGRSRNSFDANRDGLVTWAEFYPVLKEQTVATFESVQSSTAAGSPLRGAKGQTPAWYFLAEWPQHQKRIVVENRVNESVRVSLQYYGISRETNLWQWFPVDPTQSTKALTYEIAAQQLTPLNTGPNEPLYAHRVRWSAVGINSKTNYGGGDLVTVPEGGYSVAQDPRAANFNLIVVHK